MVVLCLHFVDRTGFDFLKFLNCHPDVTTKESEMRQTYLSNQNVHGVLRGTPVSSVFSNVFKADRFKDGLEGALFSETFNCSAVQAAIVICSSRSHVIKTFDVRKSSNSNSNSNSKYFYLSFCKNIYNKQLANKNHITSM